MNVTFNNALLNSLLYIRNLKGLGMPQTIDRAVTLANGNGAFYSSTDFEQRVITLDCSMLPNATKTIYQRMDELKMILSPFIGEKELKFDAYPDRYVLARYSGAMDIEQIGMLQNFPISFMCSDPLFYEVALQNIPITVGANMTIANKGSAQSQALTIKLTLAASQTVTLSNTTTGKSLVIKNPDTGAKQVAIDFKRANILDQALIMNYNNLYVSGTFFDLNPGNNVLRVSAGTAVTAQFRSAWL